MGRRRPNTEPASISVPLMHLAFGILTGSGKRRFRLARHRNLKIMPVQLSAKAVSGGGHPFQGVALIALRFRLARHRNLTITPVQLNAKVKRGLMLFLLYLVPPNAHRAHIPVRAVAVSGGWHFRLVRHRNLKIMPVQLNAKAVSGGCQSVACLDFELLVHLRLRLVRHQNLKIMPFQLNAKVKGGLVLFLLYLVPPNARRAHIPAVSEGRLVQVYMQEAIRAQECWMLSLALSLCALRRRPSF
ncbi:hypothetical protein Efla_002384 [Eimeria flavescens]